MKTWMDASDLLGVNIGIEPDPDGNSEWWLLRLGDPELLDTQRQFFRSYTSSGVVEGQPIILQPGIGEGKDIWTTSVFSYAPGGGGPGGGLDDGELRVGGWGDTYYSLIEFDLSGLPQSAESVILRLYNSEQLRIPTKMYLDRISSYWDWKSEGTGSDNERLWWADRPATAQWRAEPLPAPQNTEWYEIDITDLYNAWQDGTFLNYGLQLRPTDTANNWNTFVSSNYVVEPALRPHLLITP